MATATTDVQHLYDVDRGRGDASDVVVAILPLPSARRMFGVLAFAAAALCGLSLLDLALGQTSPLLRLFDTAYEGNVPTWLSSAMWLAAGLFAYAIGVAARRLEDPSGGRWLLLGGCFLLLAVDETAQAHELVVGPLIDAVEQVTGLAHGPARLAAVACAGAGLLALAAWLWPWMRALPQALQARLLAAGVVFVGGALGLEVLSRLVETQYLSPFEELGEMLGVALLLTALLPYVRAIIARTP
ncbi:MAG TPA: hypothetical protein VFS59_09195 [Gemmatimonadaceae bacterium]|nr:hypothetical protein [Gemmatimonadaceae bacterium]